MFYLVAGRIILIEAADEWTHQAVSEVFSGWFFNPLPPHINTDANARIRIHSGVDLPNIPPDLKSFEITCAGRCFTDEKQYYLKFDDALIVFGKESQVDFWIAKTYEGSSTTFVQLFSQALAPALRRSGVFEIHSAGVISPESQSTTMIAGASGSGKSTLTTQLANLGWSYLSDDILLLTQVAEGLELRGLRRFFALTSNTLAAVGLPNINGEVNLKHRVIPQDHFSRGPLEQSKPGAIVFPTVTREQTSHINNLTAGETMSRLLRLCPWASYDKGTSLEHLRMLGRLANSVSGFELLAGTDILNDSRLTAKMFLNISVKAFSAH